MYIQSNASCGQYQNTLRGKWRRNLIFTERNFIDDKTSNETVSYAARKIINHLAIFINARLFFFLSM